MIFGFRLLKFFFWLCNFIYSPKQCLALNRCKPWTYWFVFTEVTLGGSPKFPKNSKDFRRALDNGHLEVSLEVNTWINKRLPYGDAEFWQIVEYLGQSVYVENILLPLQTKVFISLPIHPHFSPPSLITSKLLRSFSGVVSPFISSCENISLAHTPTLTLNRTRRKEPARKISSHFYYHTFSKPGVQISNLRNILVRRTRSTIQNREHRPLLCHQSSQCLHINPPYVGLCSYLAVRGFINIYMFVHGIKNDINQFDSTHVSG